MLAEFAELLLTKLDVSDAEFIDLSGDPDVSVEVTGPTLVGNYEIVVSWTQNGTPHTHKKTLTKGFLENIVSEGLANEVCTEIISSIKQSMTSLSSTDFFK